MGPSSKQTTQTQTFLRNFVKFIFVCTFAVHGVGGQCELPVSLKGRWTEPFKGGLTFTNHSVSGFDIHTFGEFTLSCLTHNASTFYIMQSTPFTYFGLAFTAYMCWSFDEQSSDLVHLYEHTDKNQHAGDERVKMYMSATSWTFDTLCSNTNTSALTFRLLHKQKHKSKGKDKQGQTGMVVAIVVLLAVSLVGLVTFLLIRWRKSRGMFQINTKVTGSRGKASAYRVNEPENNAGPPSDSPFKNTTTTTITTSGHSEPRRHPNHHHTRTRPFTEDNTSEDAYSPSSVSVTATSAFTSVSASSSCSASSSVFTSGSGLPNQEEGSPMTPVSGSEDGGSKQFGCSDHFVPVQFSSARGAPLAGEGGASSGTYGS